MFFLMYRDCAAWKSQHLPMNTTSNQACFLFDSALQQLITWKEDPTFQGFEKTLDFLSKEDPEFIMGSVLMQGVSIIGNSAYLPEAPKQAESLSLMAKKISGDLTEREFLHVEAIELASKGNLPQACDVWEKILSKHPTDLLAAKFAHDSYFFLGFHERMRDSISRILPFWDPNLPMYSYLFGMLSFGLVETNYWREGEKAANRALELCRNDGWATHSIAHSREYQNDCEGGIDILRETEKDWQVCRLIRPHLYWHMALYHLERGEHDIVLDINRKHILNVAAQSKSGYDLVDAVSLLLRLKLDGFKGELKEEFKTLVEAFKPQVKNHGYLFNDFHILALTCLAENSEQLRDQYVESFQDYIANESTDYLRNVNRDLGPKINQSFLSLGKSNHMKVVEELSSCRYQWIRFGGSNAQRDLFHQIITDSALKCETDLDKKIAKGLVNERLIIKPKSGINDRFLKKLK